jgi:hypothetical protein
VNRFALFLSAVCGVALAVAAFWPLLLVRALVPASQPVPVRAEPRVVPASGPRAPLAMLPPYQASPSRSPAAALELLHRGSQRLRIGDWWRAVADLAEAHAAMPDRDDACVLLALAYHQLNLTTDVLVLTPCIKRAKRNGNLSARNLLASLDRSAEIEKKFRVVTSDHFVASHSRDAVSSEEIGIVLDRLEIARAQIERQLGFASERLVPIVVYDTDQFGDATAAPHWVPGRYDGKIRLSAKILDWEPGHLRHVLAHEYTHALVHEIAGGRLPSWFNEGIADNVRGSPTRNDSALLRRDLRQSAALPSIADLSRPFSALSLQEAQRAYRQSYWMTHNLVSEVGWHGIAKILGILWVDPAVGFDEVFVEVTGETPAGYLDRWYDLLLGP